MSRDTGANVISLGMEDLEEGLAEVFSYFNAAFSSAPYEICHSDFHCKSGSQTYPDIVATAVSDGLDCENGQSSLLVATVGETAIPRVRWRQRYFSERDVEALLSKGRYRIHYLPDIQFWQFFDKTTRRGLQLMQTPDGFPKWDPGSPLRNFFHWSSSTRECGLAHAGTLAVEGIGIMLAGPGGSGKSGTVLSGLMNGLDTVGDDYILAHIIQEKVFAAPIFKTLKQDPDGIKRHALEQNENIPKTVNWQGKHQFYLDDIRPSNDVTKIEVRALCIPKIHGGNVTKIHNASHKDAFLALAPSGVSQVPGDRDNTFHLCATLARNLPCYHVELSTNPREISETIRKFITDELI